MRNCILKPCLAACLVFAACLAVSAGADITTFRLKHLHGEQVFGPFEFADGHRIFLDKDAYTLVVEDSDTMRFKSLKTGETHGPYDLVSGRIMEIGGSAFVISDIRAIAAPGPDSRPPSETTPAAVPPPPAPVPVTEPEDRPAAPPVEARTVPPRENAPPFFSGAVVGVEISPLGQASYDVLIGDVYSGGLTVVEGKHFILLLGKPPVTFRFGASWDGEWDKRVDRALNGFEDAGLEDGSGLLASLELNRELLGDGPWGLSVSGRIGYRSEDYTLVYSRLTTSLIEIPGTNGTSGTTRTVANRVNVKEDAALAEWVLNIGASISYEEPEWWCSGGVNFDLFTDTDIDAVIVADDDEYSFDLDRGSPITVVAAIGTKAAGLDFRVEGRLGEERRFTVGITRQL